MIEIWGVDEIAYKVDDIARRVESAARGAWDEDPLLNGPQRSGEGLKQADVDRVLTEQRRHGQATNAATESEGFERPEPLTLARLHAVKRAALFG
ncbi:MAG: hypothetical protein ACREDO_07795 [Methyloceanibacter sp.]